MTDRPPVRVPALVSARRGRELVTEAIDGEPLSPKFPIELASRDVDDVVAMIDRLGPYRPRRRWFRPFDVEQRLRAAPIGEGERALVRAAVAHHRPVLRFSHGDVTARNVLRASTGELVLIDWEWSGLYPTGYERAFFWFSLVDLPEERERIAQWDRPWFTLSALFIQLFHVWMWDGGGRPAHHETLAMLLERVRSLT
jgi:hypothetical protein